MGYVGGYTLHLYCDGPDHSTAYRPDAHDGETYGDSHAEATRIAKNAGWVIIEYRSLNRKAKEQMPKQGVCRAFCKECSKQPGFAALKKKLTDKRND